MQDLILTKRLEPLAFSPELLTDSNWAYLQSHSIKGREDVQEDASLGGGQVTVAAGAQAGGLYRGSQPGGNQAQRGAQSQGGK